MGGSSQWGTADVEIKVPSFENPELSKVLSVKPVAGQNIAWRASTVAVNLISVFHVCLPDSFSCF